MAIRGTPSDRALRRATVWLLGFTVLFIVYASLYPFDFDLKHFGSPERHDLLRSLTWRRPPRTDLVANLIFYLPLGALVISLTPRRWGPLRRLLFTLGAGTGLSILIECAQATTLTRDPSITDVTLNGLSTGIAALVALGARGLGLRPSLPELRSNRPDIIAVVIITLWIASHAAPFMPTTRFVSYFYHPGRALDWHWSSAAFAGFFAAYVLMGAVLRSLLRPLSFWRLFFALAAVLLVARIVFRAQRLDINEVVGFVLALPMAWRMTHASEQAAYRLALLWGAPAFVFFVLAPFDFSSGPDFEWFTLPPLTSRLSAGEPGLLEVAFFYTGAVWLLREVRMPLHRVLIAMLTASLLVEVAQAWQPNRSGQLFAPLVVLVTAGLVWLRDRIGVSARRTVPSD